jgi:predicted nucleic acid-binding protein
VRSARYQPFCVPLPWQPFPVPVHDLFAGFLRFDTRVAVERGALQAALESRGRRMPWRDSVIAATARRHALAIATRNVKDYKYAGVDVVNPFD